MFVDATLKEEKLFTKALAEKYKEYFSYAGIYYLQGKERLLINFCLRNGVAKSNRSGIWQFVLFEKYLVDINGNDMRLLAVREGAGATLYKKIIKNIVIPNVRVQVNQRRIEFIGRNNNVKQALRPYEVAQGEEYLLYGESFDLIKTTNGFYAVGFA